MAKETLADLIAADAPPERHDKLWDRIRLSLAGETALPESLAPALTLTAFQITMAQRDKGRVGGFGDFYVMARNKRQAPRLAHDLAAFGLPEAARLAQAARDEFSCSDEQLYDTARLYSISDESPKFANLRKLSDEALGQDYEGAAWRALKAGVEAASSIPAHSGKRGFLGWVLSQ